MESSTNNTTSNDKNTPKGKKSKALPAGIVIPPKKPALSKAERRALQEAQRAAKGVNPTGKTSGKTADHGDNSTAVKNKGGTHTSTSGSKSISTSTQGHSGNRAAHTATGADGSSTNKKHQSMGGNDKQSPSTIANDKVPSLFAHLTPYKPYNQSKDGGISFSSIPSVSTNSNTSNNTSSSDQSTVQKLHPDILLLGLKFKNGTLRGGNARAKAMLRTFQTVISDYTPPSSSTSNSNTSSTLLFDIRHDIEQTILKPAFTYWTISCRTHSVSMGNAFTFLKLALNSISRDVCHDVSIVKETLLETIDAYIQERMIYADKAISKHVSKKIVDNDVILVYGKSEVIEKLLIWNAGDVDYQNRTNDYDDDDNNGDTTQIGGRKQGHKKNIRVIVVDSRPFLEGKQMLQTLTEAGIECTYVLLNALSYVMMQEVTKVLLGASALMSDGSILSRIGTASVALMAKSYNVPVLFCCESYKISNRVQLESITWNELGNPDDLITTSTNSHNMLLDYNCLQERQKEEVLQNWRDMPSLKLLNLLYDLTPSQFVSGIVTELGILPPTSVAVLIREMNPQETDISFSNDDSIC